MNELTAASKRSAYRSLKPNSPLFEQAGAICYRRDTDDVLLIPSRRSGRWGIPKGNIDAGETSARAAEREAFEESGVHGVCRHESLGAFRDQKEGLNTVFRVSVHVIEVSFTVPDFPETGQRRLRWSTLAGAIKTVDQPGLKERLQVFARHGFSNSPS